MRHRLLWVALALIGSTALWTTGQRWRTDAHEARAAWGELVDVAIVTEPVRAGQPIEGSVVEIARRPRAVVPAGAVSDVPLATTARVDLVPGEMLLEGRIGGGFEAGRVEVAVASANAVPALAVGDLVDVWVVDGPATPARPVVVSAIVVAHDGDRVTLAVDRSEVAVLVAKLDRTLTVVRVG